MTTKVHSDGNRLAVASTPTGGYTVDKLYAVGSIVGLAPVTTAAGAAASLIVEGVVTATKVAEANSALAQGGTAYYRTTGGEAKITGKATGADGTAGTAWAAAVTGATTCTIKLAGRV